MRKMPINFQSMPIKNGEIKGMQIIRWLIFNTLMAQTLVSYLRRNITLTLVTPPLPKTKKGNLLVAFLSL
ncbi:hypothetical protein [Psychrobacter sp.]|uniref:hypothetical protein n=1 Tax=Psychrobacter sp. TaxID=56811 RepID=UPI0028A6AB32|nr:hypothetical protein [Psychrobacter sp.]